MERDVGLSLFSVGTEVSDWLMYRVCHLKFLGNHLCLGSLHQYCWIYLQFLTGFYMEALNQSKNNSTEDEQVTWKQEPITRSLHTDYILESTFVHIFLFLEQSQVSISREIGLFSPASTLKTKRRLDHWSVTACDVTQ